MTRNRLLACAAVAATAGALGLLAYQVWGGPRAATVEEVRQKVMAADPAQLSADQLKAYAQGVADTTRRLPPHAFEGLQQLMEKDEAFRERLRDTRRRAVELDPEQSEAIPSLIPPEQRTQMTIRRLEPTIEELKQLPPEQREAAMAERRGLFFGPPGTPPGGDPTAGGPPAGGGEPGRGGGRPRREMTKQSMLQRRAQSTPTQRATLRLLFQEMRRLRSEGKQ